MTDPQPLPTEEELMAAIKVLKELENDRGVDVLEAYLAGLRNGRREAQKAQS